MRSSSVSGMRLSLIIAMPLLVAALASCGSDDKQSVSKTDGTASKPTGLLGDPNLPKAPSNVGDADVRGAQQLLVDRFGAPKFAPLGPDFEASSVKKPVWLITLSAAFPVTTYVNKAFQAAGEAAGVPTHICEGQEPGRTAICLKQAAQQGAGSAVIFSVDPKTIATPLADARKAGVKIVSGNNAIRIGEPNPRNVDAQVSHDYYDTGVVSAAYAVATWGADADSICLAIPEFIITTSVCNGFETKMKALCSSCDVQTKNVPISQLADQAPAVVNQAVLKDQGLNYIMGSIDDLCGIVAPTLRRLGKTPDDIACAGQNGNVPSLEDIKSGGYQRMTAGQHTFWWGWSFFDGGARVQEQDMPKAVRTVPNTLITRESFGYEGPIDYNHTAEVYGVEDSLWQDGFKQSWGVG